MGVYMKLSWIPNSLSLGNLFFGFISIILSSIASSNHHELYKYSVICILIAAVLDIFDGRIARKLNQTNPMGKELDSLADLITFGLAPGFMFFTMFFGPYPYYQDSPFNSFSTSVYLIGGIISFIFPLTGALRLAKFNVTESKGFFIGIPSPIAGATCAIILTFNDLPTLFDYMIFKTDIPKLPWWLALAIFIFYAALMVSKFIFPKNSPNFMDFSKSNSIYKNLLSGLFLLALILFFKYFLLIYTIYYTFVPIFTFKRKTMPS
ncbi:MAG: hypothetical protein IEMM0008_0877 [bacterium]|nr:MAG: hypothetical protein IEMM0008_0877 [bacterium]